MSEGLIIFSICIAWIGAIIEFCTIGSQAVKVFKDNDTQSLSTWMYICYIIGSLLWLLWSSLYMLDLFINQSSGDLSQIEIILSCLPAIFLNIFSASSAVYIFYNKVKNIKYAKVNNITEREAGEARLSAKKDGKKC